MRTLKQHIVERLKINKDFVPHSYGNIFNAFNNSFNKYNIKFNDKHIDDGAIIYKSDNDESFNKMLTDVYKQIKENSKEIKFSFRKVVHGSFSYHELPNPNERNMIVVKLYDNDINRPRTLWIIGKNYDTYICFSGYYYEVRINEMKNDLASFVFLDPDLTKVYLLEENIVDDVIKLVKEYV